MAKDLKSRNAAFYSVLNQERNVIKRIQQVMRMFPFNLSDGTYTTQSQLQAYRICHKHSLFLVDDKEDNFQAYKEKGHEINKHSGLL